MAVQLTSRDRARLKARAHALEPLVHVGQAGLTDAVLAEVDRALSAHELIKVRVALTDRVERQALGEDLSRRAEAAMVQRVGKTIVLWRPRPDSPPTDAG